MLRLVSCQPARLGQAGVEAHGGERGQQDLADACDIPDHVRDTGGLMERTRDHLASLGLARGDPGELPTSALLDRYA
jgi:hypothetical protein